MTSHDDLLSAFDQWVLDPQRGPEVEVPVHLRRGGLACDRWPVVDVLYELADDASTVSGRVAAALQLPLDATYGLVARVLWTSRHVWEGVGART